MPEEENQELENTEEESSESQDSSEQTSEEQDDDEGPPFHPHRGKIMQVLPYTKISSISFDKSYEDSTANGKVEMIFTQDDWKYIYDGVACKLKIRRDVDRQFSSTGIEEIFKKEEDIALREHYPTEEMLVENQDIFTDKAFANKDVEDLDVYSTMVCRSASDDGIYGFVTEVQHNSSNSEISLKDWGYCLEDTGKELSFGEMFRSELIAEVIKSYGLTPLVNFEGLDDDLITWTNMKSAGGSSSSNNSDISESTTSNECSDTYDLSVNAKVSKQGDIPSNITADMYAKIGKSDTNYGKWASGKTPQEVMSKLRSVYKWRPGYSDNAIYKCPDEYFSTSSIYVNCADAARLVKCCMDVINVKCICIHCPNHYYNAIEVDGTWYTCDLTNSRQCKTKTGSNTFGY